MRLTDELKYNAEKYAKNYPGFMKLGVGIDFWARDLETSINLEDLKPLIYLFEGLFFIEEANYLIPFWGHVYEINTFEDEVKNNYLKYVASEGIKHQDDKMFYHNYWILFFSFFIVSGVVAGGFLAKNRAKIKREEKLSSSRTDKLPIKEIDSNQESISKKEAPRSFEQFSLIFVVNISNKNIIDRVKSEGITPGISDDLCRATKALWAGKKSDFIRTKLYKEWISTDRTVLSEVESNFDVCLISIEIDYLHPGFKEGEKLSSRLEAFRHLAENRPKATVSQRLPDSSFTQTEVYRR